MSTQWARALLTAAFYEVEDTRQSVIAAISAIVATPPETVAVDIDSLKQAEQMLRVCAAEFLSINGNIPNGPFWYQHLRCAALADQAAACRRELVFAESTTFPWKLIALTIAQNSLLQLQHDITNLKGTFIELVPAKIKPLSVKITGLESFPWPANPNNPPVQAIVVTAEDEERFSLEKLEELLARR